MFTDEQISITLQNSLCSICFVDIWCCETKSEGNASLSQYSPTSKTAIQCSASFVKYISVLGVNCTSSITSNKSLKLMDQSKTHHFTVCFLQASRIVHRSSLHRSWGGAHSGQEVHFHKLEPDGKFHQGLKHKCTAQLNSCNPNLYHKLKRVANTYHDLQWQT